MAVRTPAKLVVAAAVLAVCLAAFHAPSFQAALRSALDWIEHRGAWGPVIFCALYAVSAVLFIPGSILTLGAGVLFGVAAGSVYVSIASLLGASAAFLLGRYAFRTRIERTIRSNAKFASLDEAVAREGWKIVLLTRLSPVFPFNLLNYAFGLTRVSFREYFFASWIGMLPGTVLYVYAGSLAGNLVSLGTGQRARTPVEWAFYGAGLAATAAATFYIARVAGKALAGVSRGAREGAGE